ncbi:N-acetyl-gamma-glutamyl-phosphate reductase [Aquabacter spiritensis]|uniref:N-acetyl-gamma-glutamyl-phosphate reductase n=1 Tax=Aquabacter spiritensis TaxID=933073 RepID=A0A4R3LQR8_9HYPH|nr:N-acetyl-gamma-glutamyl-phosphate reductase [Aquabacter spiritensis]TCT02904.1 N-acetyl-gamma-glutamyl-phosphate reductase [Aquabacter spiritensis]
MADGSKARIAVLGASGYTGSELVRLLLRHPGAELVALTADRKAGQAMADVFPQFAPFSLPRLVTIEEVDFSGVDLVFCALPHATTQDVIKTVFDKAPKVKVVDLSADFRLHDPGMYEKWYGHPHAALDLQKEAAFGLVEIYRDAIRKARLVANPGCHTTTAILPVVPLLEAGAIDPDTIVIDSKTGMSGAGRSAKEAMLFSEVSEGIHAYSVGSHRHMGELDQEYSKAAGRPVAPVFVPHLVPMNRGIYATLYVRTAGAKPEDLHRLLADYYRGEPFVHVLPFGQVPQSRHVRGSNMVMMGVVADRVSGRAILVSTTDNLVKGASGQAVQNMNLVLGFPETMGLEQIALMP